MPKTLELDPDLARTAGSELEESSMSLARRLRTNTAITNTADLEQAVVDRQLLGDAIGRVEFFFKPLKKAAYDLHRMLCDREHEILAPLQKVDDVKRTGISEYKAACDRAREAREREQAEQRRQEEQARATAEAAALESSGQPELAASVLAEAIAAPAPSVILPDETKGVEGLSFRRRWLWRYAGGPKDVKTTPATVIARTMGIIPREFLILDTTKVGAYAKAMKSAGKIPGIDIYHVDDPVR